MRDNRHNLEHGSVPAHQETTAAEAVDDIYAAFRRGSGGFWLAIIILATLLVAGVVGLIIRLSAGLPNTQAWGYYAATFAFLLTTVMAAPIVPIGLHYTKAVWPRSLNRAVTLFAIPGILWGLMFLPLLGALPPIKGRATIWFDASETAMRVVDTVAVFLLVLVGLALLYLRGRPDWALVRDRGGALSGIARTLAAGWTGSTRDWNILQAALSLLGGAYLFVYGYVTLLVTSDFDMSLVPGWRSPIYPTYHIVTSLQAAVATALVTLALVRSLGGLRRYIGLDQFWSLGKLQLAFTLLWFYFFWSEFIVLWYGRMPHEQALIQTFEFGPYFPVFLLAVIFTFAIPFLLLIWNPIRKSIAGPTIAATSILIGLFFDRVRLYVPAYTVGGTGGAAAGQVPPLRLPETPDVLIIVGALSGCVLLYLIGTRLLPAVSFWEFKVYLMLRRTRRFLRTIVEVVGKPS